MVLGVHEGIFFMAGQFVLSLQWICEETNCPDIQDVLKLISGYNFRVPSAAGTTDGFPQDQTLGIASTKSPCLCSKCPVEHQESETTISELRLTKTFHIPE